MITIYALDCPGIQYCLPVIENLARTKEAVREKIDALHDLDPERFDKNNVHITVYKVDMNNRTVRKGETLIGIKDLQ